MQWIGKNKSDNEWNLNMSLSKQLWLALIALLAIIFIGIVAVTNLSATAYLKTQLGAQNAASAHALAQQLAQGSWDKARLEEVLAAQFNSGSYQLIELTDPQGQVLARHESERDSGAAPGWFIRLFPLAVNPGVAPVQKDGQQLAAITLRSHTRFAHTQLWQSTRQSAIIFLIAMIVAGALGSYWLKSKLRPLADIAEQATAIGERRFITTAEPAAGELKEVVVAMNALSQGAQLLLNPETGQRPKAKTQSHVDKVSGLLDRGQFMKELATAVERSNARGIVSIIRIGGLDRLNRIYGRNTTDGMLAKVGKALNRLRMQNSGWAVARLNGSDFALLAEGADDPLAVARQAQAALQDTLVDRSMESHIPLPGASTAYSRGDAIGDMLTGLDGALMAAVAEGESTINIASKGDIQVMPVREQLNKWRSVFRQAFSEHKFSLTTFPVEGSKGELLHLESPVRLQWQGESLTATQILPWINRLELASDLDKQVVDLGLSQIERDGQPICINLSVASVADSGFLSWLSEKLSSHEKAAGMLWMEVQEAMAYRYLDNFKKLCARAKSHGAKMGIEHMGHQLSDIGQLHDVGLDYLKIDSAFIRDIDQNSANQTLVETLCNIGHSIDVTMIAEGVRNDAECNTLRRLGVDGVTGPGVSRRDKA